MENKNFKSICLYKKPLSLSYLEGCIKTGHMNSKRMKRYKIATKYNRKAKIDKTFLVDKGHPDGPELHSVSQNAVIFIINAETRRFITVLLARPGQVRRLYNSCGLDVPECIKKQAQYYIENNLNHI